VDDLAVRALFELGRTRHRINLAGQNGSDGQYVCISQENLSLWLMACFCHINTSISCLRGSLPDAVGMDKMDDMVNRDPLAAVEGAMVHNS
jgi:hypothetical protein